MEEGAAEVEGESNIEINLLVFGKGVQSYQEKKSRAN